MPASRPFALSLVLLSALWLPPPASADPDCDGGTITGLRFKGGKVLLRGTITGRGMRSAGLAAGGVRVRLVDADDPDTVLYDTIIPAERFVTRGAVVKYDRRGSLKGQLVLHDARQQHDTVLVALTASGLAASIDTTSLPVRALITSGTACARTCVAPCTVRHGRLRCRRSVTYVPFADEGFGALRVRTSRPVSSLCGLAVDTNPDCDFLIEERCILPYPSSRFLVSDASTPTGLRVHYGPRALVTSLGGTPLDPTDWNTLDGFSPGPMIMALFPDTGHPVDLTRSNVAFHTNYARSLEPDHPTVLMEAGSGERIVHFAEMDANTDDVTKKALIIRPGRRLKDASRYLVAIRRLVDTEGTPVRARLAFRALRDVGGNTSALAAACGPRCAAALAARAPVFTGIFQTLQANGVDPADLVLAWDFTTASTQALTGWMRAVRDQAFALGTPPFQVTSQVDHDCNAPGANTARRVEGTFDAPLFMKADPADPDSTADAPGSRLNLVDGVPRQNGVAHVPFVVDIPCSVGDPAGDPAPGRPVVWGHGLLGSRFDIDRLPPLGNAGGIVFGAVDMQGMSNADIGGAIIPIVQDLSKFHYIPERLHQGFLNFLLLGRLMVDGVHGFNSHAAFQAGGTPVIDTREVFYAGGSQGGILGLAVMSIAEDFHRGFLSVAAANFSTLLHRAIPFTPFLRLLRPQYPDLLDQQLITALIQQLWDRGEPNGYMNHCLAGDLSDPPVPHTVLIHMATHDSQVSNVGTEIMVRSLGIPQLKPVHRSFFQIPERDAPVDGSAFVEIDTRTDFPRCADPDGINDRSDLMCRTDADCPPPGEPATRRRCITGVPPAGNQASPFDNDAHGTASLAPAMQLQVNDFLRTGGLVQQHCAGPCDPN